MRGKPTHPSHLPTTLLLLGLLLSGCLGQPSDDEIRAHKDAQDEYCDGLRDDIRDAERYGQTLRAAQVRDEYQRNCLQGF